MEIKGYITNLGRYNEGMLIGKWIEFPIDDDDLQEVLKEIGCCYYDEDGEYHNTGYEEYFFSDWETDFENDFGEYEDIDRINEIAFNLWKWDEDKFAAACEVWDVNDVLNHCPDDYILCPGINNDRDLGYYWIEESGCYDLSSIGDLANYIDYEGYGRNISRFSNGDYTDYGFIEYIG